MSTETYVFKGITKWCKVRTPDEKFQNYQVPLYLDDDSWKKFKESKLQLKVKEDADGKYVVFKRPHVRVNPWDGMQEVLGPPRVGIRTNGEGYVEDKETLVGNGSEVTVQVDVYDTRNGKGHRLDGVGVDRLVEYKKGDKDVLGITPVVGDSSTPADSGNAKPVTNIMPF